MARMLLIAALAFGTVSGFAHGFAALGHCAAGHHQARRAAFEAHVADVCLRAAERAQDERASLAGSRTYAPDRADLAPSE